MRQIRARTFDDAPARRHLGDRRGDLVRREGPQGPRQEGSGRHQRREDRPDTPEPLDIPGPCHEDREADRGDIHHPRRGQGGGPQTDRGVPEGHRIRRSGGHLLELSPPHVRRDVRTRGDIDGGLPEPCPPDRRRAHEGPGSRGEDQRPQAAPGALARPGADDDHARLQRHTHLREDGGDVQRAHRRGRADPRGHRAPYASIHQSPLGLHPLERDEADTR